MTPMMWFVLFLMTIFGFIKAREYMIKKKLSAFDPLLVDLCSKDPTRIWSAACEIKKLRDIKRLKSLSTAIPLIQKETDGIDLKGGLYPNSEHLKFALYKLSFVGAEKGCMCELYPKDTWFKPLEEESSGNIEILESVEHEGGFPDYWMCKCLECGTKYKVNFGQYHYDWYEWKKV